MIEGHLSLLLVAIPIAALLPAGRLPWLFTLLVTWLTLALAAWQLWAVADGSVISYELGGWSPPWGIEYRIDALNALVALSCCVSTDCLASPRPVTSSTCSSSWRSPRCPPMRSSAWAASARH